MLTKKLIVALLLIALPILHISAANVNERDFLGIMMAHLTNQPSAYPADDYKLVTVSPTMIKALLEKLDSNTLPENLSGKQDVLATLLKNIKSLRMLNVAHHSQTYEALAQQLLNDNKTIYKRLKPLKKNANSTPAQIWTRKSGNKVIEILMTSTERGGLQILDFTGDFNNEFIRILMQLQ